MSSTVSRIMSLNCRSSGSSSISFDCILAISKIFSTEVKSCSPLVDHFQALFLFLLKLSPLCDYRGYVYASPE